MSRGHDRERRVAEKLREEGWVVVRSAGSFGCADLVALKAGSRPMMLEIKSTAAGPYSHFLPADRRRLIEAAEQAGADALLAWWPPRKGLIYYHASAWPPLPSEMAAAA